MTQWKDPVAVRREKVWRILRPIAAALLSLGLVALAMIGAIRYVLSHFVYPVDADDNTPIQVVIPSGSSASRIASILYNARGQDEPGLIVSTASFKVYVDFTGKAHALKAGTYVLSRNMTIPEIVNIICSERESKKQTYCRNYNKDENYKNNAFLFISKLMHLLFFSSFIFQRTIVFYHFFGIRVNDIPLAFNVFVVFNKHLVQHSVKRKL